MKLISVKFWIAHKSIKCEWKCLISSKWSGNIIRSTVNKRNRPESSWYNLTFRLRFSERCKLVFVQCGPEDTGDGNTSSAKPLQQLSSTPRQNVCVCVNFGISGLHNFSWYHVYLAANFTKFDTNRLVYCCKKKSLKEYAFLFLNFI